MSSFRLRPVSLTLSLALASLGALANDSELETIVVTGSRTPTRISDLPRSAWVVSSEEIIEQARAGVPLKELLGQLVPSLDVGPQGRTNFGQNLRGRSVLVMIDGVSLNSSRGVSRQFDSIDPYNIERIEVLSGASAMYGGGATGGVVNIVTKRGSKGLQFSTELGLRSGFETSEDHDWHIGQSLSGGNTWVKGRLGFAYQRNSAAFDASGKQVTPDITQTDLQYNRAVDVLGTLDFSLPAAQSLKLTAQYYDSGFDGDKALYLGPNLAGALGGRPELLQVRSGFQSDIEPRTRRTLAMFDYHLPQVLGGQDVYLQGSARSEKLDFYPFPGTYRVAGVSASPVTVPYYSTSRQNTDVQALKAALVKQIGDFKLSYGIDLDQEAFAASQVLFDAAQGFATGGMTLKRSGEVGRYPGFEVRGRSLFMQADWRLNEQWQLSGGLRHQRMDVSVDDFVASQQQVLIAAGIGKSAAAIPGGENRYSVTLANIGASYRLNARNQLYMNYSEGFDLPDPAKYYGQGSYSLNGGRNGNWVLNRGVSVAGSPLAGIKTRQLETGWRGSVGGFSSQLAAFHAWSDTNIQFVTSTLAINVIDQDTRNYGIEGELGYRFNEQLKLGGSLLAIKSEEKKSGNWQNQAVTAASPSKATAYAAWSQGALNLRLQTVRNFSLSDPSGARLKAYSLTDLLGSYTLPQGTLSFGIQNLQDRQYATVWGQRAKVFYGSLVAPATVDFQGRGRTFSMAYSLDY
ncbi:TonB-dependent receptor [Chitinimonas prasina]|uniref:TonB-dependent receptor n=1 Tax=Chitinimonas prasina TaxID=1434937 RepID=A0ABQ5YB94_9NEIS|nr:TonB-dependent receptor [Chitinimonas prasina]GLR12225.1 TonB-dependent receptor [Chitinimonas prasina]